MVLLRGRNVEKPAAEVVLSYGSPDSSALLVSSVGASASCYTHSYGQLLISCVIFV